MKIENGQIPTDKQLASKSFGNVVAMIPWWVDTRQQSTLSEAEKIAEIERADAEEEQWWSGELTVALLTVELPFWLMIPEGKIKIQYEKSTVEVLARHDFISVNDGQDYLGSQGNITHVGPVADLNNKNSKAYAYSAMPVFRRMKTTIIFEVQAMKDAFDAHRELLTGEKVSGYTNIRRLRRAEEYLQSLAFAHIPYLNQLITAYRSVSRDPFAFEVSEWDVPVWFAEDAETHARIGLMPYWNRDHAFTIRQGEELQNFHAATLEQISSQLESNVAVGKLELLDAISLMYRGRYADAVRSAVTSIEVVLDAELNRIYTQRGDSEEQIETRLGDFRFSFFSRLSEYEALSGRRVPGPVISLIPYINGVRLRDELRNAREVRHKIVHEGVRIDFKSRGSMLKVIETMTWLFEWLNTDDEHGPENPSNYTFFSQLRGMVSYPFEYVENGVRVLSEDATSDEVPRSRLRTSDELIFQQYEKAVDSDGSDLDLFVRMSFNYLEINCREAPPDNTLQPLLSPRFYVQIRDANAAVFCTEVDGLPDVSLAYKLASSVSKWRIQNGPLPAIVCIHHQRHLPHVLREFEGSVPNDVAEILASCEISVITSSDLYSTVIGAIVSAWEHQKLASALIAPGRQLHPPPDFYEIGTLRTFFSKFSAISVELKPGEELKLGDTIAFRGKRAYFEQRVETLQIKNSSVNEVVGPARVGIGTSLKKDQFKEGRIVYLRRLRAAPTPRNEI